MGRAPLACQEPGEGIFTTFTLNDGLLLPRKKCRILYRQLAELSATLVFNSVSFITLKVLVFKESMCSSCPLHYLGFVPCLGIH